MMKKVTILGVIFILLAVLVIPAMAKSPHGNGGNSGKGNTPVVSSGEQNKGNRQNQDGNHGNGGRGNQNKPGGSMPFYLQGTIKSINTSTKTITVTLVHGNARVKQFIGGDLTLQTTAATMYFKINQMDENGNGEASTPSQGTSENEDNEQGGSNRVAITFDKLVVGDIVAIHGYLLNGVYTARLVTVYVRAPESVPGGEPSDSQG